LLPLSYPPVLSQFRPIDRPLRTTVSKLHSGNGLVRISARMVGILLNSCCPRELQRVWGLS